ncbi:uncharacterized protein LOC121250901 [Juglans microcarpa x Juglans regia]|uniref:uncharacterized protein LOC121250901 n=1 Tax=Juglans microcarpa x Juglans regia TaxID=2249226 RepID=UPI001B7EA206|nr:uncharacterized protein LOC121250901 [Juglans microcarpa x Juglans regia]
MEIRNPRSMDFYATSVLPNCNPPSFLREKYWKPTQRPCYGSFDDAPGLNSSLRMSLPLLISIIVGKWYSPFMFIKEEGSVKNQMKKSLFYKITLERYWEEIYSEENRGDGGDIVTVNTDIGREVYSLAGLIAQRVSGHVVGFDGFMFMVRNQNTGGVGLSSALLDGMKGIQKEGGWVDGADSSVKVEKVVKMNSQLKRFCCYVLVESFVSRRTDGSTVLNCDFRHTQWIKTKWES